MRFPLQNWHRFVLCLYDNKHLNLIRKSYTYLAKRCFSFSVTFSYVFERNIYLPRTEWSYVCFMFSYHIELQQGHCKPLGLEPNNFMLCTKSNCILDAHWNTLWLHDCHSPLFHKSQITNHIRLTFYMVCYRLAFSNCTNFSMLISVVTNTNTQIHIHNCCPVCAI